MEADISVTISESQPGGVTIGSSSGRRSRTKQQLLPRTILPIQRSRVSIPKKEVLLEEHDVNSPRKSMCARQTVSFTGILTWVNFVILIVLIIFVTIYWATSPPPTNIIVTPTNRIKQITPISNTVMDTVIPFKLTPDKDSNGKYMTIPINVDIKDLRHFECCCIVQDFFFCGMVMKNLGVSGYLTNTNTAVVQIIHEDMLNAQCKLIFY